VGVSKRYEVVDVERTGVGDVGASERGEPLAVGHSASRTTEVDWVKRFEDENFVTGVDAVAVVVRPP
tara:strand:+ start:420 stop:620 length:201 start_codon:yes stop_codon:yes gene_type:complete